MRLWQKLTIIFVLLAIVPVIIIGYLAYDSGRRTIDNQVENHIAAINVLKSSELDRWIDSNERSIEWLAQRPLVVQYSRVLATVDSSNPVYSQTLGYLIDSHLKPRLRFGGFNELFLLNPDNGTIIASTSEIQVGKERADRKYFIEGKNKTYLEGVYYSVSLEQPAMTIGTPVRDIDGSLVDVLAGRLDLSELSRIIGQKSDLHQTEETYLVNNFNFFVTEPRFGDGYALKKTVFTDGVKAGLAGGEGTAFYNNYRGEPVIGAYKWLPAYNMAIITEIGQSEAFAPIVHLAWITSIIVFIIIIMVILVALLIARSITRPLNKLAKGAGIIGEGNLDYKVGIQAKDEIGELSRAFDDMTGKLKTTTVSRDELAQSEQRFRSTLDNMLEGCQIISFDWRYLYLNDVAIKHSKMSREQLLGHTMMEIYPGIENSELFIWLKQCMAKRVSRHMINKFTYPDGSEGWFELSIYPVSEGISVLSADITERRRAEEELQALTRRQQALLSTIPEIVIQTDVNKIYTWTNPAGYEFFGDDVIGREANYYFEGEQDTYEIVKPLFEGDENLIYVESWQRRRDGEKRLLAWRSRSLKDDAGNVTGALSTARDITEMKEAEEEIRKLNVELEQRVEERTAQLQATNKELEAFAYSVSHDLRSPLRAIDGYTRILLEDYEPLFDKEGKRICSVIRDNTRNMGSLIDDLLSFSRLGRTEMQCSKIDMKTMVKSIFFEITTPEDRKRISFSVNSIPPATGDPSLMRQVWMNLLSNAVKFTSKLNKPVIKVGAKRSGDKIIYTVADNGAGFDMKYANKLFGVFQRLHSTSEFEGNGVGLAIVQRVIHRHGGRVWAEGAVNEGAKFSFSLPVKGGQQ
jgi:PAS domain S-box-containing protein